MRTQPTLPTRKHTALLVALLIGSCLMPVGAEAQTVTITAPTANSTVGSSTVAVTGSYDTGGASAASAKVFIDNSQTASATQSVSGATGNFNLTWDSTANNDGTGRMVHVRIFDASDNELAANTVSVTINNPKPQVTVSSPTVNQSMAGLFAVTGTYSRTLPNQRPIRRVEVWMRHIDYSASWQLAASTSINPAQNSGNYTVNLPTYNYQNATYVLKIAAYDTSSAQNPPPDELGPPGTELGNWGSVDVSSVIINNPLPTAQLLSPLSGDTVRGKTPVLVQYSNVSPNAAGIYRFGLLVDGSEVASYTLVGSSASGVQQLDWDTALETNGSHTVAVQVWDTARDLSIPPDTPTGNSGQSATQTVTVDNGSGNIPPTRVVLSAPFNVTDRTLALSWTKNADTNFARYEVHQSTTSSFTPGSGTLIATLTEAAALTHRVTGLTPATTYYFKLKVVNTASLESVSNEVSAVTVATNSLFTPPAGAQTTSGLAQYDKAGRLIVGTDGNGNRVTRSYYSSSWLKTVSDLLGTVTVNYDDAGNVTSVTDALGRTTTRSFDEAHRLLSLIDPNSQTTQYRYDDAGRLTQVIDALSNTWNAAYNARGWLTSATDPAGHQTQFRYDARGRRNRVTDPLLRNTDATYDALSRRTQVTDPMGHTASFSFDPMHNLTQRTDAQGRLTTYAYNTRDFLTSVTNPLNQVVTLGYDADGNPTSVTDARNNVWTYEVNHQNLVTRLTQPDTTEERFAYDAEGNLIAKKDGKGNLLSYSYNARDLLTGVAYPSGTPVTYAYNANGLVTSVTDAIGTATFAYDTRDLLTSVTRPLPGGGSKTLSYGYDALRRRTSKTLEGVTTTYSFNNDDTLQSVVVGAPFNYTNTYTWDAAHRVTRLDRANGTYATYGYNNDDLLTLLEHRKTNNTLLASFGYAHDLVANTVTLTESVLQTDNSTYAQATTTFSRDSLDRLTSEKRVPTGGSTPQNPFFHNEYQYDATHNRTLLTKKDSGGNPIGTTSYGYDAANKLLTAGNITFTYDLNGNVTQRTVNSVATNYGYNFENELTSVSGSVSLTYSYNAFGERVSQSDGMTTTQFVYDAEEGDLLGEFNGSGSLTARYLRSDLDAVVRGGTTTWYHLDAAGSTRLLTNGSASVTDTSGFDAFGNLLFETGGTTNPLRFGAQHSFFTDGQSGLTHTDTGAWDAGVGRFMNGPSGRDAGRGGVGDAFGATRGGMDAGAAGAVKAAKGGSVMDSAKGGMNVHNPPGVDGNEDPENSARRKRGGKGRGRGRGQKGGDAGKGKPPKGGHDKGGRQSTEQGHEDGDARRQRDQGAEKGDARRGPKPKKAGDSRSLFCPSCPSYIAGGAALGGLIGATGGAIIGAIAGGTAGAAAGTLVAPGVGTIGGGVSGAGAGMTEGGLIGAGLGTTVGGIIGGFV